MACTSWDAVHFYHKYSIIDGFPYYSDICGVKQTSNISDQKIEHRNYIRITDINCISVYSERKSVFHMTAPVHIFKFHVEHQWRGQSFCIPLYCTLSVCLHSVQLITEQALNSGYYLLIISLIPKTKSEFLFSILVRCILLLVYSTPKF